MTDEEQNRTVAEACGWRVKNRCEDGDKADFPFSLIQPNCKFTGSMFETEAGAWSHGAPNYLHDWNAMRAAVNGLDVERRLKFIQELSDVTSRSRPNDWLPKRIVDSTLAEWAEAFLMTVGRWKENGE